MHMTSLPIHLMTRAEFNAYRKERAIEAVKAKVEQGSHTGRIPLGYRIQYDWFGDGKIAVDDAVAPLVREAFRLAAEGGLSVNRLAAAMNGKGLVSAHGKPMSPQALWFVLSNPFYMGEVRYRGRTSAGLHETLVDAETFQAVQRSLAGRARNRRDKNKKPAPPTG